MDKDKAIIVLYGLFFLGLFALSIYSPDSEGQGKKGLNDSSLIAQYDKMEEEMEAEQQKYYRSRAQDEEQYYRSVEPQVNDDPEFFNRPHPLEEKPLEEEPLQEDPLEEKTLEENPLQEDPLR